MVIVIGTNPGQRRRRGASTRGRAHHAYWQQSDGDAAVLVERIIKCGGSDLFDAKLTTSEWMARDARTYGELGNADRLALRKLDIPTPTV